MKPTQITELFANIRKTFVSFFSIFMFVALGVGIFLGISWTGPALETEADHVLEDGSFHHFQVQFPYGLTDDDLARLSHVEGVTLVEPARLSYQTVTVDDMKYTVKVQTAGGDIDKLDVVEGELPAAADEIAMHDISAASLGLHVGDTVTFELDGDASQDLQEADSKGGGNNEMKYLNGRAFKVTALVNSPDYIAKEPMTYGFAPTPSGKVDSLAWVTADAWKASAFQDGYPVVNVRCDGLVGPNSFRNEYKSASKDIELRIAELGDALGTARYDDLHDQAQKKIDDMDKQIADGKAQIEQGEKDLEEGREKLEQERAAGEQKLAEAYQMLLGYEEQKRKATSKLNSAKRKVSEAESAMAVADNAKAAARSVIHDAKAYRSDLAKKLKKGKITQDEYNAKLDAYCQKAMSKLESQFGKAGKSAPFIDHTNFDAAISSAESLLGSFEDMKITYEGKTMTVRQARKKLAEAEKKVSQGESELARKSAQLDDGWAQYYAGQEELQTKVAEGEKQIADGEKLIDDNKKKIADAEPKLADAKQKLAEMTKYDWSVMPRSYNAGAFQVSTFSSVTNNLSFSMAALFIIVGLLVSYSAVSRIVHEQITQIGTKKALGLRGREITLSFLAYSGIAVVAGAIVGAIVGVTLVEGIIGHVLGDIFTFGDYPPHFGLPLFLVVTLLELVLVLGATWLACRSILRKHAVELLRGKEPPKAKTHFYEKWAVWERLPLFTQTIVNNCVNDKRRMFSTVVGVAGCTALIVTAITLNNDVLKSYDRHYQDVYGFNAITYVDTAVEGAVDKVEDVYEAHGLATAQVVMKSCSLEQPDGMRGIMRAIVPQDEEAFAKVYHVIPQTSGTVDLSADGAWVSSAYASHFGAKVGDELTLDVGDGTEHKVPILGFYDFYLTYHEMVLGRDYYEREFGAAKPNVVLTETGDTSIPDLHSELSAVPGFDSLVLDKEAQYGNFSRFAGVSSAVVAIYLALAALMAIVVLLNLNVMFIDEKKRELIVLMINGYGVKAAKRYIYNDTIVLTVIGILCGLVLGCVTGSITVGAVEPSTASFIKDVDLTAVLVGVVGSAVLAIIMSIIALRRIPRFALTDINKF